MSPRRRRRLRRKIPTPPKLNEGVEDRRQEQHKRILEMLEVQEELYNDWERDFLDSIAGWTETKLLTAKQEIVYQRLYEGACAMPEPRAKLRPKEKKPAPRKLKPDEAWERAPTPQQGDEEFLF